MFEAIRRSEKVCQGNQHRLDGVDIPSVQEEIVECHYGGQRYGHTAPHQCNILTIVVVQQAAGIAPGHISKNPKGRRWFPTLPAWLQCAGLGSKLPTLGRDLRCH